MLTSLALIFLVGLALACICSMIKLPRIVGMLITGIVLGPYVLDFLDPLILGISSELRQMALVIILLKAGLSLNVADLKKVGRPAILLSFVPACFEIAAYVIFAPYILGLSRVEAAVMGAVMGAVSPAVVVPRMLQLMEEGYGTDKNVPQMIMAGASCDDVFVIVLFSAFTGMAQGGGVNVMEFAGIPVSIVLGILLGAAAGFALSIFFETAFSGGHCIRNSVKVIIILGMSFIMLAVESWLKPYVSVSGLLAVISMACVLGGRCAPFVRRRLSEKFGKLWLAAELILFVLVGAAVDMRNIVNAGAAAAGMIFAALAFRLCGVFICLIKTELSLKERLFCALAYMPKATVQAAIGAVPLAMGLPCGQAVLATAVLGILITAPAGAAGIDLSYRRLLEKRNGKCSVGDGEKD